MGLLRELEFMECEACAAKPGSPMLCGSCMQNMKAINNAKNRIDSVMSEVGKWRALARSAWQLVDHLTLNGFSDDDH